MAILMLCTGLVVAVSWVLVFYQGVDVSSILSYRANDTFPFAGPEHVGIGVHFFGDYAVPHLWAIQSNPWIDTDWPPAMNPDSYPPLLIAVYSGFSVFPYKIGLFAYLICSAVALLVPAVWAARRLEWLEAASLLVIGTLLTTPVLMTLDRGNSVAFIVPLLFGTFLLLTSGRWTWAAVLIAVMTCLKLYPIMLLILLVALRKWRAAVICLAATVLLTVAAFWLYGPLGEELTYWLKALRSFSTPAELEQGGNYSVFGISADAGHYLPGGWRLLELLNAMPQLPGLIVFTVTAVVIVMRRLDTWSTFAIAAATLLIVPTTAYGYNGVFAIVLIPLAVLRPTLLRQIFGREDQLIGSSPRWHQIVILAAILLTLIPLPLQLLGERPLSTELVPIAWTIALAACLVETVRRFRNRRTPGAEPPRRAEPQPVPARTAPPPQ